MDDHNSSTDPFAAANDHSNVFNDELLQLWLTDLSPTQNIEDITHQVVNPAINSSIDTICYYNNNQQDESSELNLAANNSNSTFVEGNSSGTGKRKQKEKMKPVDIERTRRQEMSSLYRSLRSVLPADYIRGKRATADHLQEAVRYIKDMEQNIAKLSERRDALVNMKFPAGSNSSMSNSTITSNYTSSASQPYVKVELCNEGSIIEVLLKTCEEKHQQLPLSKAFRLLANQRLNVINSVSTRSDDNMIHTIHIQVDVGRQVDLCQLQQQLINYYSSTP